MNPPYVAVKFKNGWKLFLLWNWESKFVHCTKIRLDTTNEVEAKQKVAAMNNIE